MEAYPSAWGKHFHSTIQKYSWYLHGTYACLLLLVQTGVCLCLHIKESVNCFSRHFKLSAESKTQKKQDYVEVSSIMESIPPVCSLH